MARIRESRFEIDNGRSLLIRAFDGKDAAAMNLFRSQLALESENTNHYPGMTLPSEESAAKFLQDQFDHPSSVGFGAFDGDRLIASLGLVVGKPDHPWIKHVGIFGMGVLKDYWGKGIGKKLLEVQEDHAREHGITRIEATVRSTNDRGLNLYTRSGYRIEGLRKNSALINGKSTDEYYIAKLLNDDSESWQPPVLETDRLVLRPVQLSDAPRIFEYAKNPNVSQFTLWEPHESVEDSEGFIKDYIFKNYRDKVLEPFGVALKESPNEMIGTVGCFWVSKSSQCMELAFAIDEEHWGKGLTAEASKAIVDFCFEEYGIKRMQCRCKAENKASARVMEKIGMTYEGTLKSAIFHRDRYWDMVYYAEVRS